MIGTPQPEAQRLGTIRSKGCYYEGDRGTGLAVWNLQTCTKEHILKAERASLKIKNQSTTFSSRFIIGRRCGINVHISIAGD